ncbi:phosphopantetheine-binding protein [Bacillus velezensis]|uniref:phosphopantetheine-binding protein n=1 Tax=Bacillus velezensis TaxID=492670 RepID=UPI000CE02DA9|nr:phosphopantetheine-binding protein [Bacillus velezensis]AVB08631.1 acyl carrier protein [Bacillus velezensis]MCV2522140.1 phosphopantetheine-binding protein [Bacillus velezensis]MEC0383904.1 phosphopantetheine-binding protein [Bacillus velezensis]MEC0387989.1 phosphopantetheine-binding protein [Bacillus velezensis]MEC3923651.1 phosphopantetheine-binding protein [Bacillus velezensis]
MQIVEIKKIIKEKILVERLELEDITPDEIDENMPLFGDGLGLDSIEALDVIAGIEEEFGVKVQGMSHGDIQEHFHSVEKLSLFIESQLKEVVSA